METPTSKDKTITSRKEVIYSRGSIFLCLPQTSWESGVYLPLSPHVTYYIGTQRALV